MVKSVKIFSKKLYIQSNSEEEYQDGKEWIDFCDGKKLTKEFENGDGMIRNYFIAYEWLEEIGASQKNLLEKRKRV